MKIEKATIGIGLAAIMVVAASTLLLVADYRSEAANHRAVMLVRGETALDALTAGIKAQGRMGRYRGDRLSYIFEELAAAPEVVGVALIGSDGAIISSGGETEALSIADAAPVHWDDAALIVRRSIALDSGGHGAGPGMGRGAQRFESEGYTPLPSGPHTLAIALDTSAMYSELSADVARRMMVFGGMVTLVLLGGLVAEDFVRRRRLQAALENAREQTAHQERLTLLGAGLAHETKNPLSIVRGQAQLIAESPEDTENNRDRAERIVDEIDRTVGHINAFLALSRPREISLAPVALGPFLERFAALVAEETRQKQVLLVVQTSALTVRADAAQLRKALLNLVINALAACGPGDRIDIEIREERGIADLTVRDTGRGIAPEDLARVTEPYFTRSENGCGLGLALVQQIARAHGWRLDLQSVPGQGTSVSLRGLESVS